MKRKWKEDKKKKIKRRWKENEKKMKNWWKENEDGKKMKRNLISFS